MLKVDGSVWTYGLEGKRINDEPIKVEFPERNSNNTDCLPEKNMQLRLI